MDEIQDAATPGSMLATKTRLSQGQKLSSYLQEYGTGRYSKKHSTFYAKMMRELGLSDRPEDYFELVPWQSLAAMNHNFLLTERRRHYLRYLGGLTFFEVGSH